MHTMKKQRIKGRAVLGLSILLLVIAVLFSGLRIWESTVLDLEEVTQVSHTSKTVFRNGVEYFPKQDITVFMLLGIDESGPVSHSGSYNNSGETDLILLAILEQTNAQLRILALNRDTMAQVPMLGVGGKYAGTYFEQLALAHTYGSGLEDSCENTRKAVSGLLDGIQIDYYLSMNMDAVSVLNDAVGGVTVEITEELNRDDPTFPVGRQRLQGEQALQFVQIRKGVGAQLNQERMQRQQVYLQGFLQAWQENAAQNSSQVLQLYEQIAPYLVTDCSLEVLSDFSSRISSYELCEIVTPAGENRLEKGHHAFYPDQEQLEDLILRLFYAPKGR